MKRLISLLLAVILFLSLAVTGQFCITANAEEAETKQFSNWLEAYKAWIQESTMFSYDYCDVNGDGIPKLMEMDGTIAGGVRMFIYDNGTINSYPLGEGCSIYKGGYFVSCGGRMGYYYDTVRKVTNKKLEEIASGRRIVDWKDDGSSTTTFYWNDVVVSEETYDANLAAYRGDLLASFNWCSGRPIEKVLPELEILYETTPVVEPKNGWIYESNNWYYYKNDIKLTGWQTIDGSKYYLKLSDGAMYTGWLNQNGKMYYLGTDGKAAIGWKQISGVWYYFNTNAQAVTGWLKDSGYWYYFNSSGKMQTGWLKDGGTWYYFKPSGNMATGWCKVGNTWYYFNTSGVMKTGWLKDGGSWYYFKPNGNMATGWCKVGSAWYYFNTSGVMKTGWLKDGGSWYYLSSSGSMVTGSLKIGSKTYRFNSSGVCLNP